MAADRRRRTLLAATLTGGSAEIIDFLLPLWAGAVLGASPSQIGALVAAELVVSFLARPVAGHLADTRERTRVAAVGAALYAASCLGYALAPTLAVAFAAAVCGGLGGALLWVSIRAITAERLEADGAAFADVFAAEAFGSWFFWVPAMVLLPSIDYPGVFGVLAAVCAVAALGLLRAGTTPPRAVPGGRRLREDLVRLRPLLGVVALTSAAEAGIGLLLLLHLQARFELLPFQIALVFLPGGIAMTVLPRWLHLLAERYGRRAVYAGGCLASAAFGTGLAFAPGPAAIAVAWVLTATAWAALTPIEQAVVAEASGNRPGRGMSLLGNAGLLGAAVGTLLAGALYDSASWTAACLVLAATTAAGAVLGPRALAALGARDRPVPEPTPARDAGTPG